MKLADIQPSKILDRPIVKFIVMPALVLVLISSSLIWGIKSQYDFKTSSIDTPQENHKNITLCVGVWDCSPKAITTTNQGKGDLVLPLNDDTDLRVKPSAAAVAATATTAAVLIVFTTLQIIALPAEAILLSGALIGAGTYLALRGF